jgi:DNA polymerase-3 subunit gamma/tau
VTTTAPHQALYRRWRAQTFSQIVGQGPVVETLRNAVRTGRVSHATLFVGPRGTGKTSLARILAKALNCTDLQDGDPCDACEACVSIREGRALDLVEIDAASNRGIDAIRELRERINYGPTDLRRKVYILDEAHQITKDAWNALLKSLEEPPDDVAFMFASTHPQDFPPAILSRLQRFDVRRLTVPEIEGKLTRILEAESVEAEPAAVHLIARLAAGGMRDAESMLDQLLGAAGGRIDERQVRDLLGLADGEAVDRLLGALVEGDATVGLAILDELDDRGRDVAVVLDQVIEALRTELAAGLTSGADPVRQVRLAAVARRLAAIDPERRGVGGLRLQVELALFAAAAADPTAGSPRAAAAPAPAPAEDLATSPVERDQELPTSATESSSQPPTGGGSPTLSSVRVAPARAPAAAKATATEEAPTTERTAATNEARAAEASPTDEPAATDAAATDAAATDAAATSEATADLVQTARDAAASHQPATPPTAPAEPATMPSDSAAAPADAEAAPSTPVAVSPGTGSEALDKLRALWPEIVAHISQNPPAKPLIAACRPISVEGNIVTLGFPEGQAFLKDALERRRPMLEEGIGQFLGRAVAVRCVATNLDLVPPVAGDADAAYVLAEARRIFGEDLVDVGEVS